MQIINKRFCFKVLQLNASDRKKIYIKYHFGGFPLTQEQETFS